MLLRNLSHICKILACCRRGSTFSVLLLLVCFLTWPGVSLAQLDICGCIGNPNSLGAFDTASQATYPLGTTILFDGVRDGITIPLPSDGVLIFDSFRVRTSPNGRFSRVFFKRNAANTPVTLLVTGDVTIDSNCFLQVDGDAATSGSAGINGVGGLGGPGGFRGGDGAYQPVNFASNGGAGLGPGGGAGGTASPFTHGKGGTLIGVPELLPLVGGSGGGGGASTTTSTLASGGGGGGGGGAILIAANGTITVNGTLSANGGNSGGGSGGNSTAGGGGSGGAIRLVANTITGTGALNATGGFNFYVGGTSNGGPGVIRMEALTNTKSSSSDNPVAIRTSVLGPLANPLTPTVTITAVNGTPVPAPPQGVFGVVDVILPAPGTVLIELATSGVPGGTTVSVTVKPQVGVAPIVENATVENCNPAGDCTASVVVNLSTGAYTIEARATFQVP